jgi:predicted RNA-binding Zn-ribbon protein involved in translation (DUF1610 family)
MGLGKMLKITFTNKVKCEKCGRVIIDGSYESKPKYAEWGDGGFMTDKLGGLIKLPSYGGDGVGLLNTIVYGSKKKILCNLCKAIEKGTEKLEIMAAQEDKEMAENRELEKENLRLQNELLKKQLQNEAMSNTNRIAPNVNRAAHFCSSCGNALKQNAKFCAKCGKRMG